MSNGRVNAWEEDTSKTATTAIGGSTSYSAATPVWRSQGIVRSLLSLGPFKRTWSCCLA
jgi:hypothetical protein